MGAIELKAVEKWYGDLQVIKGIDLDIKDGEFIIFVGPSGCGKSTLLRMIGGLEETSRGAIVLDGNDVTDQPPSKRGLSMVFQSYALYPHMSVRDNMGFSLKTAGAPKSEIEEKVEEAARVLKLEPLLDRRPKDMSGGQRQRVAIGRSIVRAPTAFLFDEPLSNLDAALRVDMRLEIAKLHRSLETTMIYVTHDQVEAMTLADRIVVLDAGQNCPSRHPSRPLQLAIQSVCGTVHWVSEDERDDLFLQRIKLPPRRRAWWNLLGIRSTCLMLESDPSTLISATLALGNATVRSRLSNTSVPIVLCSSIAVLWVSSTCVLVVEKPMTLAKKWDCHSNRSTCTFLAPMDQLFNGSICKTWLLCTRNESPGFRVVNAVS